MTCGTLLDTSHYQLFAEQFCISDKAKIFISVFCFNNLYIMAFSYVHGNLTEMTLLVPQCKEIDRPDI